LVFWFISLKNNNMKNYSNLFGSKKGGSIFDQMAQLVQSHGGVLDDAGNLIDPISTTPPVVPATNITTGNTGLPADANVSQATAPATPAATAAPATITPEIKTAIIIAVVAFVALGILVYIFKK
jgi:hypothetical protein